MKPRAKLIAVSLLFIALVLVNYLAANLSGRLDFTEDRIYTLSPGTKSLLGKIEEPVSLEFFFSRSVGDLPVSLKNYAGRIEEMLRQYRRASGGRIKLTVVDPRPDTPEEERAILARLGSQEIGTGEKVFLGLIATQADQQRIIPFLNPNREQFLEYDLSQLLYSIQLLDKRRLGLLTPLPLQGEENSVMPGRPPSNPPQFVIGEWAKSFEIVRIASTDEKLPDNLAVLAVIHPQNLSLKLQFAIDQFLLSGKPVFIAIDPASRFVRAKGREGMYGSDSSDLPTLLKGWGISHDHETIVADPATATQVQAETTPTRQNPTEQIPIWLSLTHENINKTSPATSQLRTLLFIESGSFELSAGVKDLVFTPLVQSSERAGDLSVTVVNYLSPVEMIRRLPSMGSKHALAALVQGRFKSAFPDGAPKDELMDIAEFLKKIEEPGETEPPPPSLSVSSAPGTLFLVGDTDWLFDAYSVRRSNVFGVSSAEPLNDNLFFAANALDFLSGSGDLLSIRGKGPSLRPFTVVERLQTEAQQKYKRKLNAVEARLTQVGQKLSELQGRKAEDNRLIPSPEVQKALGEFRQQEAKIRSERREIRKALREDIETLGNRLLLVNLLAMPLLVGAFGLWFHFQRRR